MQRHELIARLKSDLRLPFAVMAVMLLWILLTLVSLALHLSHGIGRAMTLQPVSATQPVAIAGLHLFGQYASDYNDLPETQLQLTLQGTEVSSTNAAYSLAIIASSGQQTKAYHVGDYVPGGATIHAIQAERVILDDNGELERLSMPIPKLTITPVTPGLPANSGLTPA